MKFANKIKCLILIVSVSFLFGCNSTQEDVHKQITPSSIVEEVSSNHNEKMEVPRSTMEKTINTYGNTPGNLHNGGYAAIQGEWIYYLKEERGDHWEEGELYRVNINDGKKEKISNHAVKYINVIGDWVYYCNLEESKKGIYSIGPIYKVRVDGTGMEKLTTEDSATFFVVENMIYYLNVSDNKIYSMRTDGTQVTQLNDVKTWRIHVMDGSIYYISEGDIYKMNLDGSDKSLVLSGDISNLLVAENFIYYSEGDGGQLFRINIDGTEKLDIIKENISSFNILGDHIYYSVREGEYERNYIYKVDLIGNNKIKISQGGVGSIVGDWNYFYEYYAEWAELERMKLDGSEREKAM